MKKKSVPNTPFHQEHCTRIARKNLSGTKQDHRPLNFKNILAGMILYLFCGNNANAQISVLQDYQNYASAPIGTYQGINFRESGLSGLYPIANTGGKEFWTLSDRGVNIDGANANPAACHPTYDKIYAFPTYAPKIHRVKTSGDSLIILQTITMKRPDGTNATGVLNPTGFGSTATEVVSTDTVNDCSNFNLKTTSKDIWGIDSEGILVDRDGNFWVCEEGGPTIWKLNSNGRVLQRFTPYANLPGSQPEDVLIDTVFKYRKNNRGFEGIAMTPNGRIYAIIQSPILYPTSSAGENTRIHRILEINPVDNSTRMFAYLNDGIIGAAGSNQIRLRDWKIGDMVAINNNELLVLEAAQRGTSNFKKIYKINISNATNVTSGLYGGLTLEALVDYNGLAANGITAVSKTPFMDLLANGWPAVLDKAEGLAILNDSTIAVSNDNDFGQFSPLEDGIATATSNLSHVIVYRLQGSNKIQNFISPENGPSTSQTPYLKPSAPGVVFTSLLTANETVGGYKMCGIPDGLGAYDNGNGTFTVLMNHEIPSSFGVTRAHGSIGAFVSKWVISKSNLSVLSGSDLVQNVKLWNGTGYTTYNSANPSPLAAFSRLCAADLPPVSAFYNSASGLGTQERIFMNGEEAGSEGRAFGHIATGAAAGTTYELPNLGKFSWENAVACPSANDKTIVVGLDDATPGQVYFYIGNKTNSGTDVDKAGLTNGKLFGVSVAGLTLESSGSIPSAGTAFSLTDLGFVQGLTGLTLNTNSNLAGVTNFLRPEDGHWDPSNPSDFYFVTTNSFSAPSRLWKLHLTDIANPELGGTITAVLDGTEGQKMMDNMTIDKYGHILLQEDVGNNVHLGKIWQYTIATDVLKEVGTHDSLRFISGAAGFLTQDEESSGIIDVQDILGAGKFIIVDQAHYPIPGEVFEGGQLLAFFNPDTYKASLGSGPSTAHTPYLKSSVAGGSFQSILTAGETVNGYKMSGIPDGTGAFDNGNGTFTFLVNHEIPSSFGAVRAHGSLGGFVSKWVVNKSNLAVLSGSDLIQNVNIWNGSGYTLYNSGNPSPLAAFSRFCSGDLPAVSAFYNSNTGLGSQERIFLNGEESGSEGRAFAHIATGPSTGTTYELPHLGKFSWENAVASPTEINKTVVAGMDDSTPGQVYLYIGTKTNSGSEVDKAGLTNGKLFGVAVSGLSLESSGSTPAAGTAFSLIDLGYVQNLTGVTLNTNSNTAGVTNFLRPEDGQWDPSNPSDFYFVTTNSFTAPSRLWKLHFTDITNPELGGTITAVLDGTEGQKMLDNMTIDHFGHVLMQEDVGNNVHIGKMWQYSIETDVLTPIAYHDSVRFISGGSEFLTQDEEASGIIDVQEILGAGQFLLVDQAHYSIPGEVFEGGQLLSYFNPSTFNANPEISVLGNNVNITDGDNSAGVSDSTDFGSVYPGNSVTRTYTIQNAGPGSLKISGISTTGNQASEFTLVNAPAFPLIIAANSSSAITVQFAPAAPGTRNAKLVISNNDFDERPFDFAVTGTGACDPTFSSVSISACNSYTWNDSLYTASGSYNYVTNNAAGCDSTATLVLTIIPFSAGSVSGPVNTCPHAGPTGQPATYSISTVSANTISWTLPANSILLSGQGTNTVSVKFLSSFVSGNISVQVTSVCSDTLTGNLAVGSTIPSAPASISGLNTVCGLVGTSTMVTYTISPVAGALSYGWSVPGTATLVNGQGTTSISVLFNNGFIEGNIRVKSKSGCGNSLETSLKVTSVAPSKPAAISGVNYGICGGLNTVTYSIPPVPTATSYTWSTTVAGATIVPSGTSATITFPAFVSGIVSVTATNSCGTSQARDKFIYAAPKKPGAITGAASVCSGSIQTYSINSVYGATSYSWTVPAGSIIQSGGSDTSITVLIGNTSGNVKARGVNACGNGINNTLSVTVTNCSRNSQVAIENEVQVYPNPSNGNLTLDFIAEKSGVIRLFVTDLTGKVVFELNATSTEGSNNISLNLVHLSKGVYQLNLVTTSGNMHKKIVLQ